MDIMSILAVLKWFIASLIMYGVLSLFVGIFIGILQYFKIKSNGGNSSVQYHSGDEISSLKKLIKKVVVYFFYGRLVTAILGLLTYRLKGWSRKVVYNHMFNNVLQEVIIQLESNYEGTGFLDYNKMIDSIESAIISTMPYVDDTYTMNEKTKTNPKGLQYTKLIHHGFRDLYNAKTQSDYNNILKKNNKIFFLVVF